MVGLDVMDTDDVNTLVHGHGCQSQRAVGFVHRADRGHARVVLGQARSVDETGGPVIAAARIDLHGAGAYSRKGDYDKAVNYYEKCLAIELKTLGTTHTDLATTYNNLGSAYEKKGVPDKAIGYYEKCLSIELETLPFDHPDLADSHYNVGKSYAKKAEKEKALEHLQRAKGIWHKKLGPEDPYTKNAQAMIDGLK